MKQLQFSRWSAGMVVLNLALLAAFLFFWLRKEYQSEKGRLEQAAHLQIADRVIEFTGLDLDSILQNIQGGDSLIAIKVVSGKGLWTSSVVGDTLVDPDSGVKKVRMPFQAEHKIVDWKNGLTAGDSLTTSISIVMTAEDTSELNAMRKAMDFSVQLRDEFNSTTEDLSGQALWNILPQGLFALGLFSISILTIVVLRRTFAERQRLLQSKNTMISNITHELKTPVATIGVALEAIQDFNAQADPVKANAYMTTARGELYRLSQSIDQILQFSQMDQGAMAFHFEPVSFKELLQKSVQSMKLQLEQRQSDFDLLLQGADWQLEADQLHLKNAVSSLLDNSLKYSDKGVRIRLEAREEVDSYLLQISDNGKGIPKAYQQKVFERFFRVPKGDVHNVKGYGLGLSYVQEIVQAHRGTIRLSSQPGVGTTIQIRLPKTHES